MCRSRRRVRNQSNGPGLLDQPAQRHLGSRPALGGGNLANQRVVQQLTPGNRRMTGHQQTVTSAGSKQLILPQIGVIIDLVGDQRLGAQMNGLVEQRQGEIGNADMARQTLALGLGQRAQRFSQWHARLRPMNQQQVNMVEAQSLEAGFDRAGKVSLTCIFFRHFGGDEQLIAIDAGCADALADPLLGAIFARRVNVAIAAATRPAALSGS